MSNKRKKLVAKNWPEIHKKEKRDKELKDKMMSEKLLLMKGRKSDFCYKCRFYMEQTLEKRLAKRFGKCFRFPPNIYGQNHATGHSLNILGFSVHQERPVVDSMDWCGEYEATQ